MAAVAGPANGAAVRRCIALAVAGMNDVLNFAGLYAGGVVEPDP